MSASKASRGDVTEVTAHEARQAEREDIIALAGSLRLSDRVCARQQLAELQEDRDEARAVVEQMREALTAHEIALRQIRKERLTGYLLQRLDTILAEFDAALAVVPDRNEDA